MRAVMYELSCGELAAIIQGRLQFAPLPPIGGRHEPVMRIVADSRLVTNGDVYWDLASDPLASGGLAEEAFARGAAGVISARPQLAPWAGSFVIRVHDTARALLQLATWARQHSHRQFAVVAGGSPELVAAILSRALAPRRRVPQPAFPTTITTATELALQLLDHPAEAAWQVVGVAAQKNREWCEISHLCCPHVAVINSARDANVERREARETTDDFLSLIAALPDDSLVVLRDPAADWHTQVAETTRGAVLRIGQSAECDWPMPRPLVEREELRFAVRGERVTVAARADWDPEDVMVAYITARILGATRPAIVAACDDWYHESVNQGRLSLRNMEVPPQVSGLREPDTSLPPGLKRHAC